MALLFVMLREAQHVADQRDEQLAIKVANGVAKALS
jgi:hypothetical protein